jgi:hypothetical protein
MTKKEMIIRTLCDYPNLNAWQISKRVGCHVTYVHKVENDWLKDEAEETKDDRQTEMFEDVEHVSVPATDTIDAVLDERGSRYGKFESHAEITQDIKRAMARGRNWSTLRDDTREALEMVAHKVGRILNGDPEYADNVVDIIGYMQLVLERMQGREARGIQTEMEKPSGD